MSQRRNRQQFPFKTTWQFCGWEHFDDTLKQNFILALSQIVIGNYSEMIWLRLCMVEQRK